MTAVLPHYKTGPANYQAATLIFGGQLVQPNTLTAGTTDLTVTPALSASVNVLGVAGTDANVISTQTGAANSYGEPLIDISVLGDYSHEQYEQLRDKNMPKAALVIGGVAEKAQIHSLRSGCEFVIATPGQACRISSPASSRTCVT